MDLKNIVLEALSEVQKDIAKANTEITTCVSAENRVVVAMKTVNGRKFKAIAKCAPEDEFDEEFGKKLAIAKLKLKLAIAERKRLDRFYKLHKAQLESFKNQTAISLDSKVAKADKAINEIVKSKY